MGHLPDAVHIPSSQENGCGPWACLLRNGGRLYQARNLERTRQSANCLLPFAARSINIEAPSVRLTARGKPAVFCRQPTLQIKASENFDPASVCLSWSPLVGGTLTVHGKRNRVLGRHGRLHGSRGCIIGHLSAWFIGYGRAIRLRSK